MKSIEQFLTRRFVVLSTVIWGICFLVIYVGVRYELVLELDRRLEDRAEGLTILVEVEADGSLSMDYIEDFIEDFAHAGDSYFQIWDAHGETFIRSGSLGDLDLPLLRRLPDTEVWKNYQLPNGRPGRIIWTRFSPRFYWDEIGSEDEQPPMVSPRSDRFTEVVLIAAVAVPRSEMETILDLLFLWMLGVGLVSMIMIMVSTRVTIRTGLKPLDSLGDYASSLDIRRPDAAFPHPEPEELWGITHRLNELLERIRSTYERERLFSTNVFHDLRTPVAELRAITEVARCYQKDDRQARDEALEQAHSIALEMDTLLDSLRELLHLQFESRFVGVPTFDRVNPIRLAKDLVTLYSRNSDSGRWVISGPDDLTILTAKAAFSTVLRQLVSNAATYAPAESRVEMVVHQNPAVDRVVIMVQNQNPGVQAGDLEHLFDPFWRGSSHRSKGNHNGLGLSIARAASEIIGGSLSAHLENDSILFRFEVPIVPSIERKR